MAAAPIGILGGTFDPIHFGHLRLAEEVLEQAQLGQVRFMPSGIPPHREMPVISAQHRSAMVKLAIFNQQDFVLDEREVAHEVPSYTVNTLQALRTEVGETQPLCLLMGGDAFLKLHTWHQWEQLLALAHIVVMQRPGRPLGNAIQQADTALRQVYSDHLIPGVAGLREAPSGGIIVFDMLSLEISATDIRRRIAERRTIRYLMPDVVADYIYQNQLYINYVKPKR
jgi:nicotinate-nucleotide adenylyltransferase